GVAAAMLSSSHRTQPLQGCGTSGQFLRRVVADGNPELDDATSSGLEPLSVTLEWSTSDWSFVDRCFRRTRALACRSVYAERYTAAKQETFDSSEHHLRAGAERDLPKQSREDVHPDLGVGEHLRYDLETGAEQVPAQ